MQGWDLVKANLLSPMVLAFVLGAVARMLKSDLRLPNGLYTALSIYLLFAIGLKGGVALSRSTLQEVWLPATATLILGLITTFVAFFCAWKLGRLDRTNAAAMAAHYGSVSAVTFITALNFMQARQIPTEGYLPALVALLEIPAIVIGLALAGKARTAKTAEVTRELLTGKTVMLLIGGTLIGLVSGETGVRQVEPLFGDLFQGALTIFLLELGLVAAARFGDLRKHAPFLFLFGILVPVVNGSIGAAVGIASGLSIGGAAVLGAMAASASYIAAPAAIRMALPQANPSLYLTSALAVTFPFNLALGIPLYTEIAIRLAG